MRSTTCRGSNDQFLEEYHSQTAALIGAEETQRMYGYVLSPYQCRGCGYWHLRSETTRRQCMLCTDSALFLKDLYGTIVEAQETADRMRREKKIQLYVYKCPHSNGWHLTKTQPGSEKRRRG